MSGGFVIGFAIVGALLTLANLGIFALTLKLYTEFFKQIAQQRAGR